MNYYESKYGYNVKNRYTGYDPSALCKQLENEKAEYLVAVYLDDYEMYAVKRYYPYVIDYSEYIGAEIYVMSKTEQAECSMPKPVFDCTYDLLDYNVDDERLTLIDTPFTALSNSRYVRLDVELFYIQKYTADDFIVALQAFHDEKSYAWREASVKNFSVPINDSVRSVLIPMRYELIFKESMMLRLFSIKSFLWNVDLLKSVRPISARIRMTPDNRYIYSPWENLE